LTYASFNSTQVCLEKAYFRGVFGGEIWTIFVILFFHECNNMEVTSYKSNANNMKVWSEV